MFFLLRFYHGTLYDWERRQDDGTEKLNDAAQDALILLVEDRGVVRCLTMNCPKALNALLTTCWPPGADRCVIQRQDIRCHPHENGNAFCAP